MASEFDYTYGNMSPGQKQHMANRLYKRDGIYAQQLELAWVPPKPGDFFVRRDERCLFDGEKYILAAYGGDKAMLVSLNNGNVWIPPRGGINGYRLTPDQWKEVCGDPEKWKKVN